MADLRKTQSIRFPRHDLRDLTSMSLAQARDAAYTVAMAERERRIATENRFNREIAADELPWAILEAVATVQPPSDAPAVTSVQQHLAAIERIAAWKQNTSTEAFKDLVRLATSPIALSTEASQAAGAAGETVAAAKSVLECVNNVIQQRTYDEHATIDQATHSAIQRLAAAALRALHEAREAGDRTRLAELHAAKLEARLHTKSAAASSPPSAGAARPAPSSGDGTVPEAGAGAAGEAVQDLARRAQVILDRKLEDELEAAKAESEKWRKELDRVKSSYAERLQKEIQPRVAVSPLSEALERVKAVIDESGLSTLVQDLRDKISAPAAAPAAPAVPAADVVRAEVRQAMKAMSDRLAALPAVTESDLLPQIDELMVLLEEAETEAASARAATDALRREATAAREAAGQAADQARRAMDGSVVAAVEKTVGKVESALSQLRVAIEMENASGETRRLNQLLEEANQAAATELEESRNRTEERLQKLQQEMQKLRAENHELNALIDARDGDSIKELKQKIVTMGSNLMCSLCRKNQVELVLACGHMYCRNCLHRRRTSERNRKCAACGRPNLNTEDELQQVNFIEFL